MDLGFSAADQDRPCSDFSGGWQMRVALAAALFSQPDLLLLDKPTNHLDVDTREALIQAINAYEGAVILVSHDPHLLELTCDRLWIVDEGTCSSFGGDLNDY